MRSTLLWVHLGVLIAVSQPSIQADQQQQVNAFAPNELSNALVVFWESLRQPVRVTAIVCWDNGKNEAFITIKWYYCYLIVFIQKPSYHLYAESTQSLHCW